MVFITADRRRKTGGELVEVKGWVKLKRDDIRPASVNYKKAAVEKDSKNPKHRTNKTINIIDPMRPDSNPTKIHFRLIQFFNGKRVI